MATTPLKDLGKSAIAEKGWLKAHQWQLLRRFSQIGIFVLFLLGPLAGVWLINGNLANSTVLGTVPLLDPIVFLQMLAGGISGITLTAVLGALIVTVFYALIGGRVFCSWVCPMNMVTDFARMLRRRLGLKGSAKIKADTRLWMLAAVVLTALATGTLAYELVNPVAIFHRGILFGFGFGWAVVVGIFLFDLLVMKDGWCGHICPMGALYSQIGRMSVVRVRADGRASCDDCMECYEVCPEKQVIPPALKSARGEGPVILSGDCTNCGACIDVCGQEVFSFGLRMPNQVKPGRGKPARKQDKILKAA
ncbi:MAG: quinol dehydrogenase ferredoxin subunit NapH [Hyphomicrobiales bacterium]|nr:MAG: quinol dehydrogenase ferredoxin subunit NapH [Hyphomicrobiales bacterium]